MKMNEYDKQAADFCKKFNVKIEKFFIRVVKGFPNCPEDKLEHEKYSIKVYKTDNPDVSMEFDYFGSTYDYKEYIKSKDLGRPKHNISDYDILSCLSSESCCPDTIEDFIDDYGYEIKCSGDLKRVMNIYDGLKKQNEDLRRIFTEEEIEALREIS